MKELGLYNNARGQLRQTYKLAAIGAFSAGIAHEINNPLSVILSNKVFLEKLLARRKKGDISESEYEGRVHALLERQEKAIQRCVSIVENLRVLSQKDEVLKPQVIDVHKVIEDAVALLEPDQRSVSIQVKKNLQALNPLIEASENRIVRILMNLYSNSVHALETCSKPEIVFETQSNRKWIYLRVSDNGAGIDPQHMAHIFNPFYTTKPPGKGAGLGLSIVHTIVVGLGGRVSAESTLGMGTTIQIQLPSVHS